MSADHLAHFDVGCWNGEPILRLGLPINSFCIWPFIMPAEVECPAELDFIGFDQQGRLVAVALSESDMDLLKGETTVYTFKGDCDLTDRAFLTRFITGAQLSAVSDTVGPLENFDQLVKIMADNGYSEELSLLLEVADEE